MATRLFVDEDQGWHVTPAATGVFLRGMPHHHTPGNIFCRIHEGVVYFFDGAHKREVPIPLDELLRQAQDT